MRIEESIVEGVLVRNMIYDETDLSTEEQRNTWITICNNCDKNNNGICTICGCIIQSLMSFSNSHCSINKW